MQVITALLLNRFAFKWFIFSLFFFLQGCAVNSFLPVESTNYAQIVASEDPQIARLIIMRPREALLAWGDSNPVQIYEGSTKITDLPHGRFILLAKPTLPENLTIHWFDDQNPSVSRTIQLKVNIQPGETQTLVLGMENETLVAKLADQEDAARWFMWAVEYHKTQDLTNSLAQTKNDVLN